MLFCHHCRSRPQRNSANAVTIASNKALLLMAVSFTSFPWHDRLLRTIHSLVFTANLGRKIRFLLQFLQQIVSDLPVVY